MPVLLEIEDVGRDQTVRRRQPALAVGRAIVRTRSGRNRASARRASSRAGRNRKTAPPATPRHASAAIAAAIALTRGSTGMLSSSATSARSSDMPARLRRQLDERQRLRGREVDWAARARRGSVSPSRMTFELSPSIVISSASSKWTPGTGAPAELADRCSPREPRTSRHRPLLDREQLERALAAARRNVARQQQLFERRHRKQREAAR